MRHGRDGVAFTGWVSRRLPLHLNESHHRAIVTYSVNRTIIVEGRALMQSVSGIQNVQKGQVGNLSSAAATKPRFLSPFLYFLFF